VRRTSGGVNLAGVNRCRCAPRRYTAAQAALSDPGLLRRLLRLSKERWRRSGIVMRKHVKNYHSCHHRRPRNRGIGDRRVPNNAASGSGVVREIVVGTGTVNGAPSLR
jgi:hypothetical protein